MKKNTFIREITSMIFVASLTFGVNAQLQGLKGVKDKVNEKTSTPLKTDVGSGVVGPPAYDPDSPTYRAYSTVRDEISSTKNVLKDENWLKNVAGSNDNAVSYLTKAKENLAKLQADPIESKKGYVKDLASDWESVEALRKSKFDNYVADEEYDDKIDAYYNFATNGWGITDESLEPSYAGYFAMRKDFETVRPGKFKETYVQKRISAVDNYFKLEVYEIVPELNTAVDKIINEMHTKNDSGEEYYLSNAAKYQKDFEKPLETIVYNRKYLLEDKSGIDAVQAKIDKEKAILDEYISSGKYEAHREKHRQAIIDAVRLDPSVMKNAKYEGMAKAGVTKGTVNRVSITTSTWFVKKNEYGFPLYKYLSVDLAVTKEGKCFQAYGQIRKDYEGGGTYGAEYFEYWDVQKEMNCSNINK